MGKKRPEWWAGKLTYYDNTCSICGKKTFIAYPREKACTSCHYKTGKINSVAEVTKKTERKVSRETGVV